MSARASTRSIRLGDPLRRTFLDELRRRVLLPRVIAAEWALPKADLTVALVDQGGPVLVLAGGTMGEEERRWVLRQSLEDFEAGDLVDTRATELQAAGHGAHDARTLARADTASLVDAIAEALERVAQLRPESASVPRGLATGIRNAVHWLEMLPDGGGDLRTQVSGGGDELRRSRGVTHPFAGPVAGEENEDDEDEYEEEEGDDGEYADAEEEAAAAAEEEEEDEDDEDEDAPPEHERISSSVSLTRPGKKRRRGGGVGRSAVWVLVLAALVAAIGFGAGVRSGEDAASGAGATSPSPTPAPAVLADHSVAARNPDGSPVRLDPCRSYEFVVQPGSLAVEVATAEAGAAFAALEGATGVAFRYAGISRDRFPHPIDPEAPPTLPILVSYERVDESLALREGSSTHHDGAPPLGGLAVGTPKTVRNGLTVVVGGALVIDEGLTPEQRSRILLHELGHLVGLGHAADPTQMMAPTVPESGPAAYRDGDLAGLAAVGAASGCALTDAERASVFG